MPCSKCGVLQPILPTVPDKMNLFLSQLKPALNLCSKNKGFFLLSVLIDIIFFFVIILINYFSLLAMKAHITKFADLVQDSLIELGMSNTTQGISPALFRTPEIMGVYHEILKYLVILIVLVLASWIVLQGLNWFIANRLIRKIKFREYALKFIPHTLFAFLCFMIIILIMLRLVAYSTFEFLPLIGTSGARIITLLLIWVLAYFVFISYSTVPKMSCRDLMKFGIKNYRQILPAHLLVSFALLVLAYITVFIIRFNYYAPFVFAVLILFPVAAYGRIYIVVVINKVLKRG